MRAEARKLVRIAGKARKTATLHSLSLLAFEFATRRRPSEFPRLIGNLVYASSGRIVIMKGTPFQPQRVPAHDFPLL
jgi:hypothetical protein